MKDETLLLMLESLRKQGLISKDYRSDLQFIDEIDIPKIRSLYDKVIPENLGDVMSYGLNLFYDEEENNIYWMNNGDKEYCPDIEPGISYSDNWLTDKISVEPFFVPEDVPKIKSNEIYYSYCCTIIGSILKGTYADLVKQTLIEAENNNESINDGVHYSYGFTKLLNEFKEMQDPIVSLIISACNSLYTVKKRSGEPLNTGLLSKQTASKFEELQGTIKSINMNWNKNQLSPEKLRGKSKGDRYNLYAARDLEIQEVVNSKTYESVNIIYRISKISVENIPTGDRLKLRMIAKAACNEVSADMNEIDKISLEKKYIAKANKIYVRDLKSTLFREYIDSPEDFVPRYF